MKIYPIFVNFNSGDQLYECINKVLNFDLVEKIVIVDNASTDKSLLNIESGSFTKKTILLKNKKNMGFYNALNKGISKAFIEGADYVMPLDFDLNINFDFISKMAERKYDMIAPVLKSEINGKWHYGYGGRINWKFGSQYHNVYLKSLSQDNIIDVTCECNKSRICVNFLNGGCTIISKKIFEKIGYYDERFFLYWGDTDFSLRATRAGFKVGFDTGTIVHHKLEISRESFNYRKLFYSFKDNLNFINKWIKWYYSPFAYSYLFFLSIKVILITISNKLKNSFKR